MDDASRIEELREQASSVRIRAIDANKILIEELSAVWRELNELANGRPEVRRLCDEVSGDIARLEKLDLAFDTEWAAEVKRTHP